MLHPLDDSEAMVEKAIFRNRPWFLLAFLLITIVLAIQALKLKPEASFEKMIPAFHPFIQNYFEHKNELKGLGNAVRIAVETTDGNIFDQHYLDVLKRVHEEAFFINGVDRSAIKSLWASSVRWLEVTEQGFAGGPVVPDSYDGSAQSIAELRENVLRSGQVGQLVANNFRSSIVYAPLYEKDPQTGEALDYAQFSTDLERLLRDKYQTDTIKIRITGFAKVAGDLIEGLIEVITFFAVALVITGMLLLIYSRCIRSTLVTLLCSSVAVVWQLGLLKTLGFGLDPYSMLIPFLVFAIGVSHAVQIINAVASQSVGGVNKLLATQRAFRVLYIPGLIALMSDGAGFATLMVIHIEVIQDLAVAASVGVAVIILSNLVLLPVLMSYLGISPRAVAKQEKQQQSTHPFWRLLSGCTGRVPATVIILLVVISTGLAFKTSQSMQIGDLDPGAPELRPDSSYNQDNAFITANYGTSTDLFVVMVTTAPQHCAAYTTLDTLDKLVFELETTPGVQSVYAISEFAKTYLSAMNEGNIKWMALNRNQQLMDAASMKSPPELLSPNCDMVPVMVYLNDHKAETLRTVVAAVQQFADTYSDDTLEIKMAAGSAGIEAATNIVIERAQYEMLVWVYAVVAVLVLLTFRSIRTVLCIMLPLAFTSLLCQALMAKAGIGVKVATLPVIALGVGIGVDYGIYIYSKLEYYLKQGLDLREAYFQTLLHTGKAVAFTGMTLAIGIVTWYLSPIKFQADMGLLLTFMFIWNMLGALILLPALAHFLCPVKVTKKYSLQTA
ncbi:TPA: RND family transporter [Pseudomonas aeruginosa]|nr:RND family transporter [Pseudomonas fluorescens]HBO1995412.1 RND family transporter [Pseudomonas aeruginosa]